jgi:hypothetical protein
MKNLPTDGPFPVRLVTVNFGNVPAQALVSVVEQVRSSDKGRHDHGRASATPRAQCPVIRGA